MCILDGYMKIAILTSFIHDVIFFSTGLRFIHDVNFFSTGLRFIHDVNFFLYWS